MPHCVIEYFNDEKNNINIEHLCKSLHMTMLESGLFEPEAVKTRASEVNNLCIGKDGEAHSFIHINVSLLEGRTPQQKKDLSLALHSKAKSLNPLLSRISVEVRDMEKACYSK